MRTALTVLAITAGCVVFFLALPPNTLSPFCKYRAQYRLDATLQVGNELLTSSVVRQSTQSRAWISVMNSAGCPSHYGTTLSFRAKNDRVFLIHTEICKSAEKFPQNPVDVIEYCSQNWPLRPVGFIVDSATAPTTWEPFNFLTGDHGARLISMKAMPTWSHPYDDLETTAPNILRSTFETNLVNVWAYSPERTVSFGRRRSHGDSKFRVRILPSSPPS